MPRTDRRVRAGLGLLALVSTGCVTNPAPTGWLATPLAAPEDVYGAWITITRTDRQVVAGEFLAYARDTVWVLTENGAVRTVPRSDVQWSRLAWYDGQYHRSAFLGALGAISTFSHGVLLVLTFPVWTIAGTAAAASDSRGPAIWPQQTGWEAAAMYARYPAGLPPGLPDRLPVKPRPPW